MKPTPFVERAQDLHIVFIYALLTSGAELAEAAPSALTLVGE
jgi:hypothetical protein